MERCANTEALNRYMEQVAANEIQYEREREFFKQDIDFMLDELARIAARIHEISNEYETIERDEVEEMIQEMIQC